MSYPKETDPSKCKEIVPTAGLRMNYHQCNGKLFKDGFCRIHHPDAIKARMAANSARWQAKQDRSPIGQLIRANARIEKLETALRAFQSALEDGPENCSYATYEQVNEQATKALEP